MNTNKSNGSQPVFHIKQRNLIAAAIFLMLFCKNDAAAQLVNIENMRLHTDTTGWKGGLGTSFNFFKNVVEVISVGANAHVQLKKPKDLYLFVADYNLLKSKGEELSNNVFFHLRYNRKLSNLLRWEAFGQVQQNAVTNIKIRTLAGTGPRFKLLENKKLKLYAGTAAMFEYEEEQTVPEVIHRDIRNSTYFSLTWQPTTVATVVSTTYYQPLLNDISDFRVFHQFSLVVKATKHFAITTDWNYLFDRFPTTGVPRYNYSISNGFNYRF